ncbi:MAG: formimidoylglutamate deiminase [Burkholderiaceae bacterium]
MSTQLPPQLHPDSESSDSRRPDLARTVWAQQALTANGWVSRATIDIGADGFITRIEENSRQQGIQAGVLLPAPANLHSHGFQRAMAGLTETRGSTTDSFWTWRQRMYQFLEHLNPDDVQAITTFAFMQMLEAGFASVGEFHYLHHQPGGKAYLSIGEMGARVANAASISGIGLTLMPVLYQQGGCDGRELTRAQQRFGNSLDQYHRLLCDIQAAVRQLSPDCQTGVAPHSLRAVPAASIRAMAEFIPGTPIHIHIAEQVAEVDEVVAATGLPPVHWLLETVDVNQHWCLVHATHMTPTETSALAASGAVAGLCPITEANLGDGIFPGNFFRQAGGLFGVGSDSNIRISLIEELRSLEYSQRLNDKARAVLCDEKSSNGRYLWESCAHGGARAIGRANGEIAVGKLADLVALDADAISLTGLKADQLLDSAIFTGDNNLITDVWAAGRHLVKNGCHVRHQEISDHYRTTMKRLRKIIS